MTNLSEQTPVQIDTQLAQLNETRHGVLVQLQRNDSYIAELVNAMRVHGPKPWTMRELAELIERNAQSATKLAQLDAQITPLEAEYDSRPWRRYFLVTNSNGHVHRGRSCQQCFPTTQYAWLVELADCDERDMVAQYGEKACTTCFPSAPTMEGWGKVAERAAAAKAAKKAEREAKKAAKAAKAKAPVYKAVDPQTTDECDHWHATEAAAQKCLQGNRELVTVPRNETDLWWENERRELWRAS